MTISNKEKAIALLSSIESGDQTAVEYVNSAKYKVSHAFTLPAVKCILQRELLAGTVF